MLKLGDKSNEVRAWQEFLNAGGERLQADGNFGPMTRAATQRWQGKFNLTADGIVGPGTIAKAKEFGFKTASPAPAASGKPILISAGHSTVPPRDPGAVGNGFTESYLALELRDLVADLVREKGRTVIEDGDDGENEPLKKAISLAKGAAAAVEFHWNGGPPSATGIEVLAKKKNKVLAQALAEAIHAATGLVLRGDRGWKPANSGQHHRLGFVEAGGLIVEICFISSKVDMDRYTHSKGHIAENLATVLAKAV